MTDLSITLFGKLKIWSGEQNLIALDVRRAQELLCYLLLKRAQRHEREKLATLMWPDKPAAQSRKYLRQAIWQIQSTFGNSPVLTSLLLIEQDSLGINPQANFWLDIALFEEVFTSVRALDGSTLNFQQISEVRKAVALYQGELLDGWYLDWIIYERERFQLMYFDLLDKLLAYSEAHAEYEAGLAYGALILRYDRARECTHRRLMKLYYAADDRTGALHQYELCVAALQEELGVGPAQSTVTLYEQICADRLTVPALIKAKAHPENQSETPTVMDMQHKLDKIHTSLATLQEQVRQLTLLYQQGRTSGL